MTPREEWATYQPASEPLIAVGQKRIVCVDGVGAFDAVVVSFDDNECVLQASESDTWTIPFTSRGMTGIGILTDGEEMKRLEAAGL